MTLDPTLGDLLDLAANASVERVHVPVLARVLAYYAATQRVDVQPIVGVEVEGVSVPAPVLAGVPVSWPRWATGADTWPLASGDVVQLMPLDSDHSGYMQSGTQNQAAPTPRRWHLADSIAVPLAPSPKSSPLPATAYSGSARVLSGPLLLGSAAATSFVALSDLTLARLQAVYTHALTHVHEVVCPPGGGTVTSAVATATIPPLPATPDPVASTNTKST